jgi:hypothetical protein
MARVFSSAKKWRYKLESKTADPVSVIARLDRAIQ